MSRIKLEVKKIAEILGCEGLNIPDYQRPYKWERKQIRNLFYDVREAISKKASEYRLGSVILHTKNKKQLDVVDGQQRLISISLFLYFVNKEELLPVGARNLLENENYIGISQLHAKENFSEWTNLCESLKKDELSELYGYMLESCTVSVIEMLEENLSEAFQLFDSQNNRGKKLDPHDLLKAYHLREIGDDVNEAIIEKWEKYIDDETLNLHNLFDKHLFRARRWSTGETGLTKKKHGSELRFTEKFIDDFKGVNLNGTSYPYLKLYEELTTNNINFPKSICMPIINGETFFNYIEYAYNLVFNNFYINNIVRSIINKDIYEVVSSKASTYSRNINLFTNLIALFIDRFGKSSLNREITEKAFVWAFYPRIEASAIYDSTLANYAAGGKFQQKPCQKLFHILMSSRTPHDFVSKIDTDMLNNYTAKNVLDKLKEKRGGK